MSIRHADPAELDQPSVQEPETRQALRDWWARWDKLPIVRRDRPAAEVLAEQRQHD